MDKISIKIASALIVLPIPERKVGVNTPAQFDIDICATNCTSNVVKFNLEGIWIPKLLDADGQAVPPKEPEGKLFVDKYQIPSFYQPKQSYFTQLLANIDWHNRHLRLGIFQETFYSPEVTQADNCWFFDGLSQGSYQMQFFYSHLSKKGEVLGRFKTQLVELRLVQPREPERTTIEVDGILFETSVPERVVTIPQAESDSKTLVQFGMRVTNLSSDSYRFLFFYLLPELVDADGKTLKRGYGRNATRYPETNNFILMNPGDDLTFLMKGELYWYDGKLRLDGRDKSGGIWTFRDIKPGKYSVRFTYENREMRRKIRYGETIEGCWVGKVYTPFVEFCIV